MMAERKLKGIVRYDNVDSAYFQRRQLRRGAGWLMLWGLGISTVISGMISGWNSGLDAAGFGGLAIATTLMAAMYMVMVYSLAEMSAALPNAGGFYAFTRSAFGVFAGYICGIAELIDYYYQYGGIISFYLNSPAIFPCNARCWLDNSLPNSIYFYFDSRERNWF
jgi:ethanolamine permease